MIPRSRYPKLKQKQVHLNAARNQEVRSCDSWGDHACVPANSIWKWVYAAPQIACQFTPSALGSSQLCPLTALQSDFSHLILYLLIEQELHKEQAWMWPHSITRTWVLVWLMLGTPQLSAECMMTTVQASWYRDGTSWARAAAPTLCVIPNLGQEKLRMEEFQASA